ncbi:MAG: hypothetical protein QM535_19670 [Limnohabitans sp.]|nr:hypothetical protein [Limnohabitans sp.]
MNKIYYLLALFVLISCTKSTYYVFEEKKYNNDLKSDEISTYCSIEINSKKEIIYRGASDKYKNTAFIYLNEPMSVGYKENSFSIATFFNAKYVIANTKDSLWKKVVMDRIPIVYLTKSNDSLINNNNEELIKFLKNDNKLNISNFVWFPPYFVKVKKIDYNKFYLFNKDLKKVDIKNP